MNGQGLTLEDLDLFLFFPLSVQGTNGSQLWDSAFAAQAFLEVGPTYVDVDAAITGAICLSKMQASAEKDCDFQDCLASLHNFFKLTQVSGATVDKG